MNVSYKMKIFWSNTVLLYISLYLILGNIPRLMQFNGLNNNLLITEIFLDGALILYGFTNRHIMKSLFKNFSVFMLIISSSCIGILYHGFEIIPLLYSIRLILLILTANIAGYLLYDKFKNNYDKCANILIHIFLLEIFISFIIYYIFSDSVELWLVLSALGIEFNGDPHQHRFVSTYFDPNFFSTIICIPLILILNKLNEKFNVYYLLLGMIFIVAIILSISRSGIATMLVSVFIVFRNDILNLFFKMKIKKNFLTLLLLLGVCIICSLPFYIENIYRITERFYTMSNDNSALARLESFTEGLDIFLEYPIWGCGYNYLFILSKRPLDSSILITLTSFGVIITGVFIIMMIRSGYVSCCFIKKIKNVSCIKRVIKIYGDFVLYTVFMVIFASQFNNLVYYQFWLFPIIMIFTYLFMIIKNIAQRNCD